MSLPVYWIIMTLLLLAPQMRGAETTDRQYQMEILKQRASFDLSGEVVDERGKLMEDVLLVIETSQYDPETTETTTTTERAVVDRRFRFVREDATGVEIKASKQGFQPASFAKRYGELFEDKLRKSGEGQDRARRGTAQQAFERYGNLRYKNDEIRLVLKESLPASLELSTQRFNLRVDPKSPRCLIPIDVTGETGEPSEKRLMGQDLTNPDGSYLALSIEKKEGDEQRLYLSCERGGGMVLCQPAQEVNAMREAPREGYQQTVDISDIDPSGLFSFYLKTRDGYFGKGTATMYYFDPQKRRASVLIKDVAVQTNGTRSVVTSVP
jgi:hypothetical protein